MLFDDNFLAPLSCWKFVGLLLFANQIPLPEVPR